MTLGLAVLLVGLHFVFSHSQKKLGGVTTYTLDECGKEVSLDTNSYITERDAQFAKINANVPIDPSCMKEIAQIMNIELQAKLAASPQATFTATDLKTLISETKTVSAVTPQ